ncbi:hypothetical protein GALMADRAFT_230477 [Galerina marginata CBS 339.88]|uniref:Uncharacterized protein n=1 Tax=Galerina marginata (strain CBS 339.88) TaxID=685588 RepID=A0A067SQ44_GALM3|nr:hypothetical protein GALMADRAFT_230477 [Galerina marginata CBS 339.88]
MDEAEEFLGSLFPSVKEEFKPPIIPEDEGSHPHVPGEDYKPSAELLALFGTLAEAGSTHVFVKPEPTETSIPDYQPSADLLKAFALLSDNVDSMKDRSPVKREQEDEPYTPSQVPVKQEASEISTYELSAMHPQKPKTFQRHVEPPTQTRTLDPRLNTRQIKIETFEHSNHPYSRPPLEQPSRDPRIRALNKRNGDHLRGHVESAKRIKSEYEGY